MGNCGSRYTGKYCNELVTEPLAADPDIVGPGVLAAFAATALITFSAIVIGYFTNSLPEEHLNSLDFAVIDWFGVSSLGKALAYVGTHFVPFLHKCLFLKSPKYPKEPLTKARREVAFEKFVLALSDQQLVTGIAILVAVFANQCRVSIYELNIAITLSWFSATTHLSTLDVLHRYFRENKVVRNWRMVGMVGVLLLLTPGLVIVEIYVFVSPVVPMQCAKYLPEDDDAGIGPLASVFVIAYLCVAYASRLYKTFTSDDGSMIDPEWLVWNFVLRIFSKLTKAERHAIVEKAINVCNTRRTVAIEQKLEELAAKPKFTKRLGLCIGAYTRSFLHLIAALTFLLSYGMSGVAATRWLDYHIDLEEESSTWGFGQIVPLILLILPMLAFAEIFYETPEAERAHEHEHPHPHAAVSQDHNTETIKKLKETQIHNNNNNTTLSTTTTASLTDPFKPSSTAHRDTAQTDADHSKDHGKHPAPHYSIFAKADIKSRLPRAFLDRSRRLIQTICLAQILLGICTGILLNLGSVGASGGAILICMPWVYNIASFVRRFTRVGKVVKKLRKREGEVTGEEFEDIMSSNSWEKMTDRRGRVVYVHHGVKETRWGHPDGEGERIESKGVVTEGV